MDKTFDLFRRYPKNPIITPEDISYPVNSVFNAGATLFGDETLLLMRVEDRRGIFLYRIVRLREDRPRGSSRLNGHGSGTNGKRTG